MHRTKTCMMDRNLLLLASLCLVPSWMLPVDFVSVGSNFTIQQTKQLVPLDMVKTSVDDMYKGCREKMAQRVHETYFPREIETSKDFKSVWESTTVKRCVNRAKQNLQDPALTENHLQAICVYTSSYDGFYKTFNDAVRSNSSIYGSSFKYHSLHFWLTSAVQILNKNKRNATYRRTNLEFTGVVGQKMRFGSFTSSSYKTTLNKFGKKTCFKITTCSGADLERYSVFGDTEQEVLIPPYEVFTVTKRATGSAVAGLEDCEVVYILESRKEDQSNLNCKAGSSSTAAFSGPPLLFLLFAVLSILSSPT